MSEFLIPILFTVAGIGAIFSAYRGIRKGAVRVYTLEREAILRRATYTMMLGMLFFLAAVGLLIYDQQQQQAALEPDAEELTTEGVAVTTTPVVEQFPPLETPTPIVDFPTPTPTPIICRAVVDGTAGSGLMLRETPGGAEITILQDGSILTLLEDAPVEANGLVWRKVRTVFAEEGWVAQDFITIGAGCE
ncbi:MAG: SH3 domain-containing protein [Chloroflexi bacterium]|nr:MAG: SH3 domain-containing protein [Chloroflexota bacterium]